MSLELKRQIADAAGWVFKGLIALAAWFTVTIFNDVRTELKTISKDLDEVSKIVIRLDEKVERNKENIDRLDRQKQDKR